MAPKSSVYFTASQDSASGRELITLCRRERSALSLKDKSTAVAFDLWTQTVDSKAVPALSRILQAWADNEVDRDGEPSVQTLVDAVSLSTAFVASLSEAEALMLGLPPATPLVLQVAARGMLQQTEFRLERKWMRPGGVLAFVQHKGSRITADGKVFRLVEPLYSTVKAIDAVNNSRTDSERLEAVGAFKMAVGEEAASQIQADGYIDRLRISYAAAFSLDLNISPEGFDFDPVLFSREAAAAAIDDTEILDESVDSLLPPEQQSIFKANFRHGSKARSAYLLSDGGFLFIDPSLRQVLDVVHTKQNGTVEERKEFVRNARRVMREVLGQDKESAELLFVETQQFSERVSGIDVWRKPVLPWIKPKPNSWLPEAFGLRVGEGDESKFVNLMPEEAEAALAAIDNAIENGQATVTISGEEVPATMQSRAAVSAIVDLTSAIAKGEEGQKEFQSRQRYFLEVRDNLEETNYQPSSRPRSPTQPPAPFPTAVRTSPKSYQKEGFDWLVTNWRASTPGVLLADDMGLGKTFQALSFVTWLRTEEAQDLPVLIVAPTGLLANWQLEIDKHLKRDVLGQIVKVYGGNLRTFRTAPGRDIDEGGSRLDTSSWSQAGVVLTTYETLRDYHMSFARLKFSTIIYDEIQKLKNPASQATRAAKTLNARLQIAMTGTPVENRLQDLWSIIDVVYPGYLGSSKSFEKRYVSNNKSSLKALNSLLRDQCGDHPPVLLRRMKSEYIDGLPNKSVKLEACDMPTHQAEAYASIVQRALAVKASGERGRMLEILHQLRGVSLHPRAPETAFQDTEPYISDSARLKMLFKILDDVSRKNEKVLIFCESLSMQAFIAVEIRRKYRIANEIFRIHGGVAGDHRQEMVTEFQTRPPGFDVMILSPKAGGVGLNITAANHVVHLSRWWNPAVEDQATDRAYRIGQTKEVSVYIPQSVHPDPAIRPSSFDLKLDALMTSKRALSRDLLLVPEDDGDAATLFDAVMGEGQDAGNPTETIATNDPISVSEPQNSQENRSNSIVNDETKTKKIAASRIKLKSGAIRDFTILFGHLTEEEILYCDIHDPYACSSEENTALLVEFVKKIRGIAKNIKTVRIKCWDGDTVNWIGGNSSQRRQLFALWEKSFGSQLECRMNQVSRRSDRSFHDRVVEIKTISGRKLLWDLSNGVDGVMKQKKECTVVITEP